ncbi:hypothetical protein, partial [Photobacterium halotolerans]
MVNAVSEVTNVGDEEVKNYEFYVVSPKKFTILFLSTLGLYSIYWSYQNWSLYKKSVGSDVWPIARGIFDIFFLHSLCGKLSSLVSSSQKERADLEWQAIQYVLLIIVSRICDRLAIKELGLPYTYFASLLLLPFAC